jgi:flagellar hook protein FlgE
MFSGVSGIISHQTKMDVIGNNISNINTLGFKSSRVTFQEVYSQTLRGSGAPDNTTGRGGTNPIQVGLGINVAAVDTVVAKGSTQRTDNPTDMSIDGEGFFIVKDASDSIYKFTRAGNFTIDKAGNLVTPGGLNVYGWQDYGGSVNSDGSYSFDTEKFIEPINLYSDDYNGNKKIINAQPTENAQFSGNLRSTVDRPTSSDSSDLGNPDTYYRDDNIAYSVPFTAFDSLGNDNKSLVNFWKMPAENDSNGNPIIIDASGEKITLNDSGTALTFDADGDPEDLAGIWEKLSFHTPDVTSGDWVEYDSATDSYVTSSDPIMTTWHWSIDGGLDLSSSSQGELTFYANGETYYYVNDDGQAVNVDDLTQEQINELHLTRVFPDTTMPDVTMTQNEDNGADDVDVNLNFKNVTQFASDSSAKTSEVDGYASGTLVTFSTGSDGILTGIYSNGQQQPLGMVSLAGFQNPAGLQKIGENLYLPTTNSGDFENGLRPGSEGIGNINPGTLEMSNVDLSKEFTDMIVTQRGFQANGKIITTSDEMLQELVNLKR